MESDRTSARTVRRSPPSSPAPEASAPADSIGTCRTFYHPARRQPLLPTAMTNRLASETSPYLLQHAENPVDWMPWGKAALARARREDKPIFLSIGYAACHWCHVVAHQSLE